MTKFEEISSGFRVTLFKEKLNSFVNDTVNDTVNDRQKQIVMKIAHNNNITIDELCKTFKVARSTIIRDLNKLKEFKIISRVGSDKKGHWIVITNK